MASINTVFDADEIELNDLRADPNTIIKIQSLVKEMLESNDNRRMGIQLQILEEYGTFALPGIISATYVLADQLNNQKRRDMISGLLFELCHSSIPAQRLLLRSGIIESPFDVSRSIAAKVLRMIDGVQMFPEDVEWLIRQIEQLLSDEERKAVLIILELLLDRVDIYDFALDICSNWFASEYEADAPVKLANILLKIFPERTEQTFDVLFDSLERHDNEAGRNMKDGVDLGSPEAIIPAIKASSNRLDTERTGRVKPVEFLFEGAIARQLKQNPDYIDICNEFIQTEPINENIQRYWWQALSAAVKQKSEDAKRYFEYSLANVDDEEFAIWGAVQLLFLETAPKSDKQTKTWATQTLQDLRIQQPELYQEAQDMKNRITSGSSTAGKRRRQIGNTDIN